MLKPACQTIDCLLKRMCPVFQGSHNPFEFVLRVDLLLGVLVERCGSRMSLLESFNHDSILLKRKQIKYVIMNNRIKLYSWYAPSPFLLISLIINDAMVRLILFQTLIVAKYAVPQSDYQLYSDLL